MEFFSYSFRERVFAKSAFCFTKQTTYVSMEAFCMLVRNALILLALWWVTLTYQLFQVSSLSVRVASPCGRRRCSWRSASNAISGLQHARDNNILFKMGPNLREVKTQREAGRAQQSVVHQHDKSLRLDVLLRLPGHHLRGHAQLPHRQRHPVQRQRRPRKPQQPRHVQPQGLRQPQPRRRPRILRNQNNNTLVANLPKRVLSKHTWFWKQHAPIFTATRIISRNNFRHQEKLNVYFFESKASKCHHNTINTTKVLLPGKISFSVNIQKYFEGKRKTQTNAILLEIK